MKKKISGSDGIDEGCMALSLSPSLFLMYVPYIYCYVSTRLQLVYKCVDLC